MRKDDSCQLLTPVEQLLNHLLTAYDNSMHYLQTWTMAEVVRELDLQAPAALAKGYV